MNIIKSKEEATSDVTSWLDFKKVNPIKRETYRSHIDTLIGEVMIGGIVVNNDFSINHNLKFPAGKSKLSILKYSAFLNIGALQKLTRGLSVSDGDGRVTCYICALTTQPKEIIKTLESQDFNVALSVSVFFT